MKTHEHRQRVAVVRAALNAAGIEALGCKGSGDSPNGYVNIWWASSYRTVDISARRPENPEVEATWYGTIRRVLAEQGLKPSQPLRKGRLLASSYVFEADGDPGEAPTQAPAP